MRYFITGGAGFIGSTIARQLLSEKAEHEVGIYDAYAYYDAKILNARYYKIMSARLSPLKDNPRVQLMRGDIRETSKLAESLRHFEPDVVIHLAAVPIASIANTRPEETVSINAMGTTNVLNSIRSLERDVHFVYTSSSFVYGNKQFEPITETHPTTPIDVYGAAKLAGENITQGFGSVYGIDWTIIRPIAVYGPGDSNIRVLQKFVLNALADKPLILYSDKEVSIDFTHVGDVASGFIAATKTSKSVGEIFNIASGHAHTLADLAAYIKTLHPSTQIKYESAPASEQKVPSRGTLSNKKAAALLGWKPKISFEAGVKSYYEWLRHAGY